MERRKHESDTFVYTISVIEVGGDGHLATLHSGQFAQLGCDTEIGEGNGECHLQP